MNYMVRAEISNGMVLASNGDLNGMMLGTCTDDRFYLLNPRQTIDFVPVYPVFFSRGSGTLIKRARVDILGAPGIMPSSFEVGGPETAVLSGATFTLAMGNDKTQITVPQFEAWFDVGYTFAAIEGNPEQLLEVAIQSNLPGGASSLYCLYDAGNMQDYYKGRNCKGVITLEIANSLGASNV